MRNLMSDCPAWLMAGLLMATLPAGLVAQPAAFAGAVQTSVDDTRIGQQLISIINFTALPGISGARFDIDRSFPDPDYRLEKLDMSGSKDLTLADHPFDLHIEGGIGYLSTDENAFGFTGTGDQTVAVRTDREVYSGHFGLGLSIPMGKHWRLRPVLRAAISRFNNDTGFGEVIGDGEDIGRLLFLDWTVHAATLAGALKIGYDRSFEFGRVEATANYTYAYTDIFDAPSSLLEFSGRNELFNLRARLTRPTGRRAFGYPLLWNVFAGATALGGNGKSALGFSHYFELGAGLDLDVAKADLPLVKVLRLQGSLIKGDNVTGWQLGLGFRF